MLAARWCNFLALDSVMGCCGLKVAAWIGASRSLAAIDGAD